MASVLCIFLKAVLIIGYIWIVNAENETVTGYNMPPTGPAPKPPGAIASFVKMIMDIPMGLVEAFKDAADGIDPCGCIHERFALRHYTYKKS